MFDFMMSKAQLALREEIRDLVKWVPRQMILDMDADKLIFPREFLAEAGRRNLMGCRYPRAWGGRGMDWRTTVMVMEEVGVLGYIFAIERIVRDLRLAFIWTGTNEVMSMIIASQWYREYLEAKKQSVERDVEMDAPQADRVEEKVYC